MLWHFRDQFTLCVEPGYIDAVNRLTWAVTEGKSIYELELLAKTKRSYSVEQSKSFPYMATMEVHSPSVFAFVKLTDAKIIKMVPTQAITDSKSRVMYHQANFDASGN
ncbi:MAG TPA: hypothetical protein VEV84_00245 [Pyrinomonadaceae bacterium]|jgi:hypothetical protein|nr:hypothetical protein [Pyrinomonadaceae bacterium]